MADIVTTEQLQNASLDVQTLETFVNGTETQVNKPRLIPTVDVGSIAELRKKVQDKVDLQIAALPAGHKGYATLALAQAAQASLPANTLVEVTNDADSTKNGVYLWNGTTLTKSSYDPLTQSISASASSLGELDLSALSGNYNLSFLEAITLIPSQFKRTGLKIKYNNQYPLTYVSKKLDSTSWTNPRLWIAQLYINDVDGLASFDKRMIRKGFILTSGEGVELGEDNYCAIVPVRALGDGSSPVTLSAKFGDNRRFNFHSLNKEGVTIAQAGNVFEYTVAKSTTLRYIAVNLQWRDTTTGLLVNEGAVDFAKNFMSYKEGSVSTVVSAAEASKNTFDTVIFSPNPGVTTEISASGVVAVNPYFVSSSATNGKLHIAQFVKKVEVSKGHRSLINKKTGELRKIYIGGLTHNPVTRAISVHVGAETDEGKSATMYVVNGFTDNEGIAVLTWSRSPDYDTLRVRMTIDTRNLPLSGSFAPTQVHPSVVAKGLETFNYTPALQVSEFVDMGVSKTISNYKYDDPMPLTNLSRGLVNGMPFTTATGDVSKDHQQTTLMGSKLSRMSGKANIYIEANAAKNSTYEMKVLREKSSIDPLTAGGSAYNYLGGNDSQYVHPDIAYSPTAVGGYKYWMVNSNYPNSVLEKEEADLFVSNDGQDWKRVKGFNEVEDNPLGVKNPEVFWDTPWVNSFCPSPYPNSEFEFALEDSLIVTDKIQSRLTHDPAITAHNGYIIVYTLYNFKLLATTPGSKEYKFVTCLRTNDGLNWEIVREDGSTMPYNQANAKTIFSKTGGVRNHHLFRSRPMPTGTRGLDISPQVVKVSDNEWYMYTRNITTVTQGYSLFLTRYSGTSPYSFDYNNPTIIYKDKNVGGDLWHYALRFYDGLYYLITNGFLFTSVDGVAFKTNPYPFFWRGMSSDLYKPSFVKGHDELIKIVYSVHYLGAAPNGLTPQLTSAHMNSENRLFYKSQIWSTIITQYAGFDDMNSRSSNPTPDAFVDVVVMVVSLRSRTTQIRFFPCLRESAYLKNTIDVGMDDEVYVLAYMNSRYGGTVNFGGVSLDLPDNAYLALQ